MPIMVRQHQWVEMAVTPVDISVVAGEVIHTYQHGKEPQITIGCFACNMGLSEGIDIPCPGQDLFEEP